MSGRNPRVQRVRRLARRRRDRAAERAFVVEGPHAVAAALDAGVALDEVLYEAGADDALVARARAAGVAVFELEPGTLAKVSDAVTPQPVVAVAPWCDADVDAVVKAAIAGGDPRHVVVLHDVRDPGNVGTLLRTAEASGAAGLIVSGQSVDVFSPKCVRSSAGALFHLPVAVVDDGAVLVGHLREAGLRVIGADAGAPTSYDQCALLGAVALFLGNEAAGLPPDLLAAMDGLVSIPIDGRAESLNVAAAGAVLCFEAARQRRTHP